MEPEIDWNPPPSPRFRVDYDRIEVTMLSRADEGWTHVDRAGHEHYWTFNGQRGVYDPAAKTDLPTLRRVVTGIGYYPDGESYEIAHYECRDCGEQVKPRTKADDCRQFIPGLRHYYINDESVTQEVYEAAVRAEAKKHGIELP